MAPSHTKNLCIGGCGSCTFCSYPPENDHAACLKEASKASRRVTPTPTQLKGILKKPKEFSSIPWPKTGTTRNTLFIKFQTSQLYDAEMEEFEGLYVGICCDCEQAFEEFEEKSKKQG
jgi:hypothetical protein